jgi:hypothetical protein
MTTATRGQQVPAAAQQPPRLTQKSAKGGRRAHERDLPAKSATRHFWVGAPLMYAAEEFTLLN